MHSVLHADGDREVLMVNLEREIQRRTSRQVRNLRVEYIDGTVIVHGQVQSYHAKQLILVAAMNYLVGRKIEIRFAVEVD